MELKLVDTLPSECLAQAPENACIFHNPAWVRTLEAQYGFRPLFLIEQAEKLRWLATFAAVGRGRLISLPFTDLCEPLVGEDELPALAEGLNNLRHAAGIRSLEVRWPLPPGEGIYPSQELYWHFTPLNNDPESVFRHLHRTKVQIRVQKAISNGLVVRRAVDWEDMLAFYKMHLDNRRRLGVPVQPLGYFHWLWKNLVAGGLGFIMLVYQGEQLLSANVFLHWKRTLTAKYNASDKRYWDLHPNHLMLWEAMRWGCQNGMDMVDWGRTDPQDTGLRTFKLGWGSQERLLHYTNLADKPPVIRGSGSIRRIMKSVIQHSPPWVCRVAGELLYRFAA